MMDSRAGLRYARALYLVAEKQKTVKAVEHDFANVVEITSYPEVGHIIANSAIPRREKEDFIEKLLSDRTSQVLVQFLKVLIKKNRFSEIAAIQKEFHRLYEEKQGIQSVTAVSAVPLSKTTKDKLCQKLKEQLNAEIRLKAVTDSKMIGGLVVRFGDTEINGSYKDRLEAVRQQLLA